MDASVKIGVADTPLDPALERATLPILQKWLGHSDIKKIQWFIFKFSVRIREIFMRRWSFDYTP